MVKYFTNETELAKRYYVDLAQTSVSELHNFEKRVEAHGGLVRLVVHPDYEIALKNQPDQQDESNLSKIRQMIYGKNPVPVILMLERMNASSTIDQLRPSKESSSKKVFAVMPTYEDSPQPQFTKPTSQFSREPTAQQNWTKFIRILNDLGVKRIIISGRYLVTDKDRSTTRFRVQGCVNQAAEYLQNHFTVEYSNLSFPSTRADMIQARKNRRIF